jgi:hypothetical protein
MFVISIDNDKFSTILINKDKSKNTCFSTNDLRLFLAILHYLQLVIIGYSIIYYSLLF